MKNIKYFHTIVVGVIAPRVLKIYAEVELNWSSQS